jgi:nucleoid DNA-binding protein
MDDLIGTISVRAGVDKEAAKHAVGAILNYIKRRYSATRPTATTGLETEEEQAAKGGNNNNNQNGGAAKVLDLAAMLTKLDGAEELMKQDEAEEAARKASEQGAFGLFGLIWQILKVFGILLLLQKLLSPILGIESSTKLIQAVEDGAEVKTILAHFGIEKEQALKVVRLIFDFLKDKLDPDTVTKITNNIPAIKALLVEEKKEE